MAAFVMPGCGFRIILRPVSANLPAEFLDDTPGTLPAVRGRVLLAGESVGIRGEAFQFPPALVHPPFIADESGLSTESHLSFLRP
jgi:hypothetical protein